MSELDEDALQDIYTWIDDIPLTRPKKNIARDFSDGVLVAEIIHHFLPKLVDLHNYISVNSTNQKVDNWNLLARKCFNKLAYNPDVELIRAVTHCKTGAIETVLGELRTHIEAFIAKRKAKSFVAKNQIQDQFADPQYIQENGYDNAYGYPAYTDPNYHNTDPNYHNTDPNYHNMQQQQQQQQVIDIPPNAPNPYQYQSPPHVIQDIRYNPSSNLPQQELSPRHTVKDVKQQPRKPVTQATKPKSKLPAKGKVAATTSTETSDLSSLRITLEEKEQALLASQETVQILQVKIRRLEHLLHLKDMRINELKGNPVSQEQVLMLQQHHQTSQQPQPPIHHPLPQYAQPSHQQPIPPAQKYTTQQANIPSHHPNAPMNTRPQPPAQHPNPNMNNNRNVPMQQYNYASMKFNAQPPLPGIPKTPPIDHER